MPPRRPTPRPGSNHPRRGPSPGSPARRPPQRRPFNSNTNTNQAAPGPRTDRDRRRDGPPPAGAEGDGLERLQKVLAHAGVSSRRACEELIRQGRITVDGQVVRELGTKVDPRRQQVAVDGQKVHAERNVYYAVHKPKGYVSTNSDPAGKPLVINLLPEIPQRAYAVGRLDEQSTGLMLLTNDGELANKLAHPKFGVEKVYRVVVAGEPGRDVLDQLTQGIWLAEGKVRARRVKVTGRKGQATVLEMVLAEGKNREIRRMLAKLGHKVMSLTRIAVGPIGLKGLGVGECRPLTGHEVELLRKVAAGMVLSAPRYPDRRERIPRPEGTRRPAPPPVNAERGPGPGPGRRHDRPAPGPGRPQRPASGPREGQGHGHGPGRPQRPPHDQGPRLVQGPGPRDGQGAGPGRPPRPPYGQGPRPAQGQGQSRGPSLRPPEGQGTGPIPGSARRPPTSQNEDRPTRRIIGLDPAPAPRRPGPTGPRLHRPGPKRPPRSAQGMKRPPRRDEGTEE